MNALDYGPSGSFRLIGVLLTSMARQSRVLVTSSIAMVGVGYATRRAGRFWSTTVCLMIVDEVRGL